MSLNPSEISWRPDLHSLQLPENSPLLGIIQKQALFPLSCDINITKTTLLFVQRAAKNREIAQFKKKKKKGMCFQKQFCTSSKTKGCAWMCAAITLTQIISCPDFAPKKAEISCAAGRAAIKLLHNSICRSGLRKFCRDPLCPLFFKGDWNLFSQIRKLERGFMLHLWVILNTAWQSCILNSWKHQVWATTAWLPGEFEACCQSFTPLLSELGGLLSSWICWWICLIFKFVKSRLCLFVKCKRPDTRLVSLLFQNSQRLVSASFGLWSICISQLGLSGF